MLLTKLANNQLTRRNYTTRRRAREHAIGHIGITITIIIIIIILYNNYYYYLCSNGCAKQPLSPAGADVLFFAIAHANCLGVLKRSAVPPAGGRPRDLSWLKAAWLKAAWLEATWLKAAWLKAAWLKCRNLPELALREAVDVL